MVETATRARRRQLRFDDYDHVLGEVRSLAACPTRQLGNWSLGQVCQHLGTAMHKCTEAEPPFPVPLRMRILGRLVRRRVLQGGLPRGFKLPPEAGALVPPPVSVEHGLATLQRGIATLAQTTQRTSHPVLGALSVDQWTQFHLRHAELHLSFIVPE